MVLAPMISSIPSLYFQERIEAARVRASADVRPDSRGHLRQNVLANALGRAALIRLVVQSGTR
jgi:hypothetical protein